MSRMSQYFYDLHNDQQMEDREVLPPEYQAELDGINRLDSQITADMNQQFKQIFGNLPF